MLGYGVLAFGLIMLWIAATGKGEKFLTALKVQLPSAGSGNTIVPTPATGGSLTSGGGATLDSGSHMGIDANGDIVSINKAYNDMTNEEKDAANAFARKFPSGQ